MMNKRILFLIFNIFFGSIYSNHDFADSFLDCYDISPNGLYSRGYPTYLAQRSKKSLFELEDSVKKAGINVNGRIIISGYEKNAFPSFKFDFEDKSRLNDEQTVKGSSGYSFAPGNTFGFTTGFLLKDCNQVGNNIFKHTAHNDIELFQKDSELLQIEAFGENYKDIKEFKKIIESYIARSKPKDVFKVLVEYWKSLYEAEKKEKLKTVSATQDILFSIIYGNYLHQSNIDIVKFFIGPDITYPIRVLPVQPVEATRTSQKFLDDFTKELIPRGGKTAYILCSFVDGVGKSTSLGNLINWKNFKKDFNSYEAVNNSSSQLATLYPFDKDVVLVDLPAQVSHFCAKPYGHVFVGLDTMKLEKDYIQNLSKFIQSNLQAIQQKFATRYKEVSEDIKNSTGNFYDIYLTNLVKLGINPNWIPFEYKNNTFVINLQTAEIKMLVSFDDAHSCGLKVREPELMLFEGSTIPMDYSVFLNKLVQSLQKEGVENVVFVDYISMYPRSSRENVRVNFMLQQLKQLFGNDFDIETSFYRHFASSYEIYPLIKKYKKDVIDNLVLEVLSRDSLNDCILKEVKDDVLKYDFNTLIQKMREKIKDIPKYQLDKWTAVAEQKLKDEFNQIKHYKYSKIVESCWLNPLSKVAELTEAVTDILGKKIVNNDINKHWSGLDDIADVSFENKVVTFVSGSKGKIIGQIPVDSHSPQELEKIYNLLRVVYNETFKRILRTNDYSVLLPGIVLKKIGDSYHLIQKIVDEKTLNVGKASSIDTSKGDYLYGYYNFDDKDKKNDLITSQIMSAQMYSFENQMHKYKFLNQENFVSYYKDFFVTSTQFLKVINIFEDYGLKLDKGSFANASLISSNYHYLELIVRAMATVDFLIKHPKQAIMSRYGIKDDFISTVILTKKIKIPMTCGLDVKNIVPNDVEPIINLEWKKKDR